jgi:CheY-like chemotaxis protein
MAKQILYVEDHLNNMLLVKRIVEAEGHSFLTSPEGEGGWQLAVKHKPDLIFVDLRLPGEIDGYELLRWLKADTMLKDIPAVVITAYGKGDAEDRARQAGCDGFLHKPADIRQIREVIRRYVGPPAHEEKRPASDEAQPDTTP